MIARAAVLACFLLAPDAAETAQVIRGTAPSHHSGAPTGSSPAPVVQSTTIRQLQAQVASLQAQVAAANARTEQAYVNETLALQAVGLMDTTMNEAIGKMNDICHIAGVQPPPR